jgi:hypothetical protein
LRDVEQTIVLVRGVEQCRLAGSPTSHYIDVVGDRPDHESMDLT